MKTCGYLARMRGAEVHQAREMTEKETDAFEAHICNDRCQVCNDYFEMSMAVILMEERRRPVSGEVE